MANKPSDVMGIGLQKEFQPYQKEDGWTVVLPGEEDGRRGDKKVVAVSHVEIRLKSASDLSKCLEHLEESDRRLQMMKSQDWDWQRVETKGNTVRFGVAWYNRSFFENRKDAWQSKQHSNLYTQFGASEQDFTVVHEVFI
jgi:hypothetical protein